MKSKEVKKLLELEDNFLLEIDPTSNTEINRLSELYDLSILDTEKEEEFDQLTELVSAHFNMPFVLLSFISENKQWFKSSVGSVEYKEIKRDYSICKHVVAQKTTLYIEDLTKDSNLKNSPFVSELGLRFYTGTPLITKKGNVIGTLCLLDKIPRKLSSKELRYLEMYASSITNRVESRREIQKVHELQNSLVGLNQNLSKILTQINDVVFETNSSGFITFLSPSWEELTGYDIKESLGSYILDYVLLENEDELKTVMDFAAKQDGTNSIVLKCRTKDNQLKSIQASVTYVLNEDGQNTSICGTLVDVTIMNDIKKEKEEQLQLATSIQHSVLSPPLENNHISIKGEYHPSHELSGDLYYWDQISPVKYGVIIMDVVGHGVAGALISMSIRSLLKGMLTKVQDPIQIYSELNMHMKNLNVNKGRIQSYFTAIYVVIDVEAKTIEYVNAGHPAGFLFEGTTLKELDKGSIPIGIMDSPPYIEKGVISYNGKVNILLYTDGLLEILKKNKENTMQWFKQLETEYENSHYDNLAFFVINSADLPARLPDDLCVVTISIN